MKDLRVRLSDPQQLYALRSFRFHGNIPTATASHEYVGARDEITHSGSFRNQKVYLDGLDLLVWLFQVQCEGIRPMAKALKAVRTPH